MIQQDYKNNVQATSGTIETTGFSIEVNESMFQMLTSNVYNDPTLAVMREWSTNACDACIAANKKVEFDVHLPTMEEPIFAVRDYGTGLPPEDIKGLFSNLGASTKRNSDAYNGTLGIGRMAGLAVADAFTVDSYYEGTHYSYVISMQKGVPVTMHLGNNPTDERNGLKLSVAVELDAISSYRERAESLYKYFDHKPTLNIESINIELDISEHISDKWFIQKSTNAYRESNYVVMSQVAYEIPYSREINTQGFSNLVMKVEPGAVTFNPGRESLSLNKATVEYLNKTFEEVAQEYVEAAENALQSCSSDFELMKTYNSLISACPRDLAKKINPTPYMSSYITSLFSSTARRYGISNNVSFEYLATSSSFDIAADDLLTISSKNSYNKNAKVMNLDNMLSWREFFFSKHVIVDLKSKFRKALNDHFAYQQLITWQKTKSADFDEAISKAKEFLDGMGIPYQLASDLVNQEDFKPTGSAAPREGFYASDVVSGDVCKSYKMEDSEIENNEYLHLKLKHTTPVLPEGKSFEDYQAAYYLLCQVTKMPEVKGVAKKYQDYVESLDNWLDYETYIEEKMKEVTFKINVATGIPRISAHIMNEDTKSFYPQDIIDYYEELRDYHNFNSGPGFISYERDKNIAERMGASFVSYEPTKEIDLEYLENTYPKSLQMLTGNSYYYDANPELCSYIAKLEEFYAIHSSE